MRRLAGAVAMAIVVSVALAAPASAHAQLVSTTPAAGRTLDEPPDELVVRFDEGVEADAGAVRLHDSTGRRRDVGSLRRDDGGKVLVVDPGDLEPGGYVLTWRVVSLDGHPLSGGVTWRLGAASASVDDSLLQELLNAEGGDTAVGVAAAVVRGVLFASLLLLVGALVLLLLVWPAGAADGRLVPTMRASTAVAALATVLGMGLQGADVAGQSLSHAFALGAAVDTLDTTYGQAAAVRLLGLAALGALVWQMTPSLVRRLPWRVAAQAMSVVVLASVGAAGHARTGRWAGLALPVDVVHLLAAATWIGGLAVLLFVVLPGDAARTTTIAARFSTIAAYAVGLVVLTGLFQSVRQVESLDALRETNYGRLLVLKVVGVAVIAVLGAVSRSLVRNRVATPVLVAAGNVPAGGDDRPADSVELRRAVRRSVGAEALLAVVVIALTSLLVAADPGRAAATVSFSEAKVVEQTVLELVAAPARTGPVDIHLYATDPSFGLTPDLEATATMALPDRDIPPVVIPIRYAGRGHWSAYDVDVAIAGTWRVEVTVVVGEFDQRRASFNVPID